MIRHIQTSINTLQNFNVNIMTFKRMIVTNHNHVSMIFDEVRDKTYNDVFINFSASVNLFNLSQTFKFKAINSSSTFRIFLSINNKSITSQQDQQKKHQKQSQMTSHQCRRCFRIYCSNNELHRYIVSIHIKYRRHLFSERNHRSRDVNVFWRKL